MSTPNLEKTPCSAFGICAGARPGFSALDRFAKWVCLLWLALVLSVASGDGVFGIVDLADP